MWVRMMLGAAVWDRDVRMELRDERRPDTLGHTSEAFEGSFVGGAKPR